MTEANVRGQKITFAKIGQPYGTVGILAQNWFRDCTFFQHQLSYLVLDGGQKFFVVSILI